MNTQITNLIEHDLYDLQITTLPDFFYHFDLHYFRNQKETIICLSFGSRSNPIFVIFWILGNFRNQKAIPII